MLEVRKMSSKHALRWSFLSELPTKAIQPVIFIVLGRLLTPENFGVMAAAMIVIAFSQIFWEAGMGKAFIQRRLTSKNLPTHCIPFNFLNSFWQ